MERPKVLIVTASIGAGHTQAANAVRAELQRRDLVTPTVVDFFDAEDTFNRLLKETYLKMLNVLPDAYDLLYRWSQEPLPGSNLVNITALAMKRRMLRLLAEHRPQLVLFTHPFPCCAAAYLRRHRQLDLPLVAVLTDFAVHRLWVAREVDRYCVAHRQMKETLAEQGIPLKNVRMTGIPIAAQFGGEPPAKRLKYAEVPSLLVMGGGLGLGAVEQAVAGLAAVGRPLAITVVAGRNAVLARKMTDVARNSPHRVEVIGFTDRIGELMAGANLLITKAGALTCSEALAMGLPLVLFKPIPGQEEENTAYLTSRGVAVKVAGAEELAPAVARLLARPGLLAAMSRRALADARPAAAAAVADTVHECLFNRRDISPAI